jgi:hypothetical protein
MSTRIAAMVLMFLVVVCGGVAGAAPGGEKDVRDAAVKVFRNLKDHRYEELYDSLPTTSRQRTTKERFVSALRRSEQFYKLDRLEIGAVRVSGDLAVADTSMYGHVYQPIDSDGKIVAQQYMVKENGAWKVATGDRGLIQRFLSQNPEFAKKFPVRNPKIYIKRDGQWLDVSALAGQRRKG